MSETAHQAFGHELMMAHGLVCFGEDDDLHALMQQWPSVTDEYDKILAAARAVVEDWDKRTNRRKWKVLDDLRPCVRENNSRASKDNA